MRRQPAVIGVGRAGRRHAKAVAGSVGESLEPRVLLAGTIDFDISLVGSTLHPTLRYFGSPDPGEAPFTRIEGGGGVATTWIDFPELDAEFDSFSDFTFDFEGGLELLSFQNGASTGTSFAVYGSTDGNGISFDVIDGSTGQALVNGAIHNVDVSYDFVDGATVFSEAFAQVQLIEAAPGADPAVFNALNNATGGGTGSGLVDLEFGDLDFTGPGTGAGDAETLSGSAVAFFDVFDPQPGVVARASSGRWWSASRAEGREFEPVAGPVFSSAIAWEDLQAIDLDGDGRDDFIGRNASNNRWVAAHAQSDGSYETVLVTDWADGVTFVDTQFGDFNGDGLLDVISRHATTGAWVVGLTHGGGSGTISWNTSVWARWSPTVDWVDFQVGEFDNVSGDDVVARHRTNGKIFMIAGGPTRGTTSNIGRWSTSVDWLNVVSGDFNDDGLTDLAGRTSNNGTWWVSTTETAGGPTTIRSRAWGQWSTATAWQNVTAEDFDGDGFLDIVGQAASSGSYWMAQSNTLSLASGVDEPTSFRNRLLLGSNTAATNWTIVASDFDNDGREDRVGFDHSTGRLRVAYNRTGSLADWTLAGRFSTAVTWANWSAFDRGMIFPPDAAASSVAVLDDLVADVNTHRALLNDSIAR